MAIVTGDRYLESLVRFVDRQAGPLLDGTLTLKLNPVGLHYVQSRLEALQEVEGLLAGAPVDYLRAYVSDLGDHRALEQLRRILGLLTSLKVISVLPPPVRDPTPLSLLPFGRLRVLELRGCDLSTSAARGLLELRHSLEKLICHNSTDALRHVFASRIADIKESPVWIRLSYVSCACNGLVLMDESLQLLPAVETLDLSRNQFAKVDNLRKCTKLQHLDLGFNHLRTVASLSEVSCPIVKLVLRNNVLTTMRGIENLKSVQGLDLSYNIISSFSELEVLGNLSCLQSLWLEGNPVCCARWYRAQVFSFFPHPEKLMLDEKGISARESWERQIILSRRQKRPAGFGFYFPAKDDADDESNPSIKRRKHSRLACIEDEEQRRYSSEAGDQESISCQSDSIREEANSISDEESEILGLMNRVQNMKKEQSVLWLREFKEWMDQTSSGTMEGSNCIASSAGFERQKDVNQSIGEKHLGEGLEYIQDVSRPLEGVGSSFIDVSAGFHGEEHDGTNEKGVMESSLVNGAQISVTSLGRDGLNSEQVHVDIHSNGAQNLSPPDVRGSSHLRTAEGCDLVEFTTRSASFTAIDEIMGSRTSSLYPGSPPHYQEGILHQRLNLEEEFLQLSTESLSVASSDSDTSSSDDDWHKCEESFAEMDQYLSQETTKMRICECLGTFNEPTNHEDRQKQPDYRENSIPLSGTEPVLNVVPYDSNTSLAGNVLDDVTCNEVDDEASQSMPNTKGRRKLKRRVVPLSENHTVRDENQEIQKSNGYLEVGKPVKDTPVSPTSDVTCSEEASMVLLQNHQEVDSQTDEAYFSMSKTKVNPYSRELDELIKDVFHMKIADSRALETLQELVRCDCIFLLESIFREIEIAVLRSSNCRLYMLLLQAVPDGRGIAPKVIGCHTLNDIRDIVVGLGLQTLRVSMADDATYLFLTRTTDKLRELLCVLGVCDSTLVRSRCLLQSWEQVQVKLLKKHLRGSSKVNIFMYSMLLFWDDHGEGKSWVSRSLFVIEGFMIICIEDIVLFNSSLEDLELSSPYYCVDTWCPIQNILEVVIEPNDIRCTTLVLDQVSGGNEEDILPAEKIAQASNWKLKWYSEDTMLKFVELMKAIYAGLKDSPLPVECVS